MSNVATAKSVMWFVPRAIRHALLAVVTRWRRSLQLRVGMTTLLVSGVVVIIVGVLLNNQITAGLLDAKRNAATQETSVGLTMARQQLESLDDTDPEALRRTVASTTDSLARRGSDAGLFDVAIVSQIDPRLNRSSGDVEVDSIPDDLIAAVRDGNLAYEYDRLHYSNGESERGLIVGGPLGTSTQAQLYYLFSLKAEADTVELVQRTVFLAGIVLVLLVAGIATLVTRQVVRPVRMAAATASRFAAGRLEERMQLRGEDELSLLAARFNDMADSLQQQINKLEEMSRLQRRFTSDVSHELRTPLTTIGMASDVLHAARSDFSPEAARSAELLHAELERFESLLNDLLEVSRYDAGAAILEPEQVDLRVLLERAVAATAFIVREQGSHIVVNQPDTPVMAEIDSRRVQRILRNLIGNAAEHGEGKPIEITVAGDDHAVAVAVRDHGIGLRPGEASLVFNRFWRADPSRDRRTGGTGLGLAISQEDARLHGGWLHAWGRPGMGARFRLTLPKRLGDTLASSPLALQPAPSEVDSEHLVLHSGSTRDDIQLIDEQRSKHAISSTGEGEVSAQ